MDFSTPETALRSLRRRDTVPDQFKGIAEELLLGPFAQEAGPPLAASQLEDALLQLAASDVWECVAVGFLLSKHLVTVAPTSAEFRDQILSLAEKHLEHPEPRVRGLVAQTLGAVARAEVGFPQPTDEAGTDAAERALVVYRRFQRRLSESIKSNYERTSGTIADRVSGEGKQVAVDDTTGWKALETSLLALRELVDAIGRPFLDSRGLTPELLSYIVGGATTHVNRHVREASFKIIASILRVAGSLGAADPPPDARAMADAFAGAIARGLQDNWSQVRFAASVACRALLEALQEDAEWREAYYPQLLPRMCLNRYYMAEGVKLYSQETWRIFMRDAGREQVARFAGDVADYYAWASDADNHVVREAACHSIAEAAVKVEHSAMAPHVPRLLSALLVCFHDDSWPVRDAACVATGRFAGAYPEECRSSLDDLWERWLHHLSDPIWSVREDSAMALAEVCRAYGQDALQRVCSWVEMALPKAKEQPAQSHEEWRRTHNDAAAHTDKQRYSCGSLAPKLKKGSKKRAGCCSDVEISRPSQPWEFTDGAIYMVRELCNVAPERAIAFFPVMAEAARITHFVQADFLRETLFKQLPAMANAVGKREFKRHMELFLDPLFATLQRPNSHQLALHAAGACARELSVFVGPAIFRGRLSPEQLQTFETNPMCRGGASLPPLNPPSRGLEVEDEAMDGVAPNGLGVDGMDTVAPWQTTLTEV